jgi:hypothetical protein
MPLHENWIGDTAYYEPWTHTIWHDKGKCWASERGMSEGAMAGMAQFAIGNAATDGSWGARVYLQPSRNFSARLGSLRQYRRKAELDEGEKHSRTLTPDIASSITGKAHFFHILILLREQLLISRGPE